MNEITTNSFSNLKHTFVFQARALEHVNLITQLDKAVEQFSLPVEQSLGSETLRMWFPKEGSAGNVKSQSEGQTIFEASKTDLDYVDVVPVPYYIERAMSTRAVLTNPVPYLKVQREGMGEDLGYFRDQTIRDEVIANTNNTLYARGLTSFANLNSASYATGSMVLADIDAMVTKLKNKGAKPFPNKRYKVFISPQQSYDIRRDSDWQNMVNYNPDALDQKIDGYIGSVYNADVFESMKNQEEATTGTEGTFVSGGNCHVAIAFGRQAVGITKMSSEPGAYSPKTAIFDKAEKSDRGNQWMYARLDFWHVAKLLKKDWTVICRSRIS